MNDGTIKTTLCLICLELDIGCECHKPEKREVCMDLRAFMNKTLIIVDGNPEFPATLTDLSTNLAKELAKLRREKQMVDEKFKEYESSKKN
jgi:hypothetical protein